MSNVFHESLKSFLKPIAKLLEDESITEIMINGPSSIWVERSGKIEKTDSFFPDEDSLRAALNNIAQSVGRQVDENSPRLDARLPNGYRIHGVIPPCARAGTSIAIRKFSSKKLSFKDLINFGAIDEKASLFLDICMKLGKNILVSGGTGSGKTTFLSILCSRIPKGQRVIIIEDSSELQIDYEHSLFFETRQETDELEGVSVEDLVKSSLRLRPDRIIVGEVRGAEALDLVQAMNTGHKGCLGTIHANTPLDALVRLEALSLGSKASVSEKALVQQISSGLDILIQVSRYSDGSRKVSHISELIGLDEKQNYITVDLFKRTNPLKTADSLESTLEVTGSLPSFMSEIENLKLPFHSSYFKKKQAA